MLLRLVLADARLKLCRNAFANCPASSAAALRLLRDSCFALIHKHICAGLYRVNRL